MSGDENKSIVRRFLHEVIERQDLSIADALQTAGYTLHMPGLPRPVQGLEEWKGIISGYFAAFPDLDVTLEDEIADDDRVAIRYSWSGTQRGDFMGVPATGKPVRVAGMVFFRIADGKVAEEWHMDDTLSLLQQLGTMPAPF